MKTLFLLLALTSSARATEVTILSATPVAVEEMVYISDDELSHQITLFGSGIQDRKTKEIVALACIGEAAADGSRKCDLLQHLLFSPGQSAPTRLGPAFKINLDLQKPLSDLSKKFKQYRWNNKIKGNVVLATFSGILGIYLGPFSVGTPSTIFSGLAIASAGIPGGAVFYLGSLLLAGGIIMIAAEAQTPLFGVQNNPQIVSLNDTDGWNWSTRPHRISHKKFNDYMTFVGKNVLKLQ